jgi:hypothetical protein
MYCAPDADAGQDERDQPDELQKNGHIVKGTAKRRAPVVGGFDGNIVASQPFFDGFEIKIGSFQAQV